MSQVVTYTIILNARGEVESLHMGDVHLTGEEAVNTHNGFIHTSGARLVGGKRYPTGYSRATYSVSS